MAKIFTRLLILAIIAGAAFHLLNETFGKDTDEDARGYTPVTLLNHYLDLCQEGKLDEAVALWTPESLEQMPTLKEYCQKIGTLNLEYSGTDQEQFGTTSLLSAHVIGNENIQKLFYFELRDSHWHLHYNPLLRTE